MSRGGGITLTFELGTWTLEIRRARRLYGEANIQISEFQVQSSEFSPPQAPSISRTTSHRNWDAPFSLAKWERARQAVRVRRLRCRTSRAARGTASRARWGA